MPTDIPSEQQVVHPNLKLLSHSSSVLLHKCPRKYELYKLSNRSWKSELKSINSHEELSNVQGSEVHLDFGSVVGIGTQEYLVSGNLDKAIFLMFMAWENYLDNEDGEFSKKTFWYALAALDRFVNFRRNELSGYSVAEFEGKPAIELGYIIDCGNGYTNRGFLDSLLLDNRKKELIPYEGKTTKNKTVHEANYKNSGQALGYKLVTDAISRRLGLETPSSIDVLYSVYKTSSMEWEKFLFRKSYTQAALWIKNILLDIRRIEEYSVIGYFPMQGENCFDFFRPCEHFGTCEMSNSVLVPQVEVKKDDMSRYQFHFSLEEIIATQFEKQGDAVIKTVMEEVEQVLETELEELEEVEVT